MDHPPRTRAPRATPGSALVVAASLWLGFVAASALALLLGTRLVALTAGSARARVDGLVELGVVAAGVAVLVWLALSCAVAASCLTARVAGGGWSRGEMWVHRWAPVAVRRAVVLAVGAGLGLSAATGASAADVVPPTPSAPGVGVTAPGGAGPDLGWVPTEQRAASAPSATTVPDGGVESRTAPDPAPSRSDAPLGMNNGSGAKPVEVAATSPGAPAATHAVRAPARTTSEAPVAPSPDVPAGARATSVTTVTVEVGDTLWAIASRYLPAGADERQIATAWPVWYAANAGTIGDDPDVIRPGQTLEVPSSLQGAQS